MRAVFLLLPLVLVGCKPDSIEACVEAEKKRTRLQICRNKETGKDECSSETWQTMVTLSEPRWRKEYMRAAAGKEIRREFYGNYFFLMFGAGLVVCLMLAHGSSKGSQLASWVHKLFNGFFWCSRCHIRIRAR